MCPISKHHKKKYPNSEWRRRRNIRREEARLHSKLDISDIAEATVDLKEPQEEIRSVSVTQKPKGLFQKSMGAIKRVFAGPRRSSKDAV